MAAAAEPQQTPDGRPITGFAEIDQALEQVADLADRDLADHPAALTAAHETLAQALDQATGRP